MGIVEDYLVRMLALLGLHEQAAGMAQLADDTRRCIGLAAAADAGAGQACAYAELSASCPSTIGMFASPHAGGRQPGLNLGALFQRWDVAACLASRIPKPCASERGQTAERGSELAQWLAVVRRRDAVRFVGSLAGVAGLQDAAPTGNSATATATASATATATGEGDGESFAVHRLLDNAGVAPAAIAFMGRVGSVMYGLAVPSSDTDYSVIYCSDPLSLLGLEPPSGQFDHKVAGSFGDDKSGEVEISGTELSRFVADLTKGNPNTLELLFAQGKVGDVVLSEPSPLSWVWDELVGMRSEFITRRCYDQYTAFVRNRLAGAAEELARPDASATKVSKYLYAAYHKLGEVRRLHNGLGPLVSCDGPARDFIMRIRTAPLVGDLDPRLLIDTAKAQLAALDGNAAAVTSLPQECNFELLKQWLRSVRRRHLASTLARGGAGARAEGANAVLVRPVNRTSSDETPRRPGREGGPPNDAAICGRVRDFERETGCKVVFAAERSSRVFGTSHAKSDHDIVLVYVLPRTSYFAMQQTPRSTLKRTYDESANHPEIDFVGWEVRHAANLACASNSTFLETVLSPLVYVDTAVSPAKAAAASSEGRATGSAADEPETWLERMRAAATKHFDRCALAKAWVSHAHGNFRQYIVAQDRPIRKKYGHILRPLLSTLFFERQGVFGRQPVEPGPHQPAAGFPPLELLTLVHAVADDDDVPQAAVDLLGQWLSDDARQAGLIQQRGDRQPVLDGMIERLLARLGPAVDASLRPAKGATKATATAWARAADIPRQARRAAFGDACVALIEQETATF